MYFTSSLAGTFTTVSVAGTTTGCPFVGINVPFVGSTSYVVVTVLVPGVPASVTFSPPFGFVSSFS